MRSDVTENKKSTLSGEKEGLVSRTYLCMDLKSFYASVECADRDLDPLTTNLVVADPSRTEKTICLAVSPSLKAYGISGRARLFEVIEQVRRANVMRKKSAPGGRFTGSSVQAPELAAHPEYQIDYLIAPPRMAHYMEVSTRVYDKSGANLLYSILKMKYTFFASDGSNVMAVVLGEAMDSGDKASNKAMSIAFKYACFQVFCIPTEEMEDPDATTPEPSVPKTYNCVYCNNPFEPFVAKNGVTYTAAQAYHMSERKYGRPLCKACVQKLNAKPVEKKEG